MLKDGKRFCDVCHIPIEGKRAQIRIESVDESIFLELLSSMQAFKFAFEKQADGSVTLDACVECNALLSSKESQDQAITD